VAIPKLIRRAAFAVAILAGVMLVLVAVAHLPPVRARVLDYARDYAARELGIALEARSLDYNLLGPSAELRGVVIASIDDQKRLPLLYADGIRIVLGRSLFLGQVDVSRLELVRPRLVIVRRADGTLNLPRGRGAASTAVTPLHLGRVDIRELLVSFDDEVTGRSLSLGAIDLAIDTSSPTAVPGAFGPSPFGIGFRPAGTPAPVTTKSPGGLHTLKGTIAGRLGFDGTRLLVPALTIETPEGRLALDGSVDVISAAPRVDVRARARVDVARAARLADLAGEGLAGTLNATGEAKGLMTAPAVRLGLDGSGLAVRSLRDVRLTADSTIAAGRLKVSALDLRSPLGVVHAQGDVALASGGAPSRLDVRWSDVDLDAAIGTLGDALPARIGSSASGTAVVRLEGSPGPAWLSGLDADVSSTLRPGGGGLALAGALDGGVRDGAWTLAHRLTSAPAAASLAGTIRGRLDAATKASTLDGGTRLRVDDLGAATAIARDAGVALPESIAASLGGTLDADVRLRGTLARPAVQATLAGRNVRANGIAGGTVDATLAATRDALRVQSLAIQLGPTRLHAAGSYAWDGRADVRFDAQAADLAALARTFELSAPPIAGSAQVTGRCGAPRRRRRRTPRSRRRASRSMASTSDAWARRLRSPGTGCTPKRPHPRLP